MYYLIHPIANIPEPPSQNYPPASNHIVSFFRDFFATIGTPNEKNPKMYEDYREILDI